MNGHLGFPFLPRDFRENRNGYGVIRERELLRGNWRELELTIAALLKNFF